MISPHINNALVMREPEELAEEGVCDGISDSVFNWNVLDSDRMRVTTEVPIRLTQYMTGNWPIHKDSVDLKVDDALAKHECSPEALKAIEQDIEKAESKALQRLVVSRGRLVSITRELAKLYPLCSISLSGFFLYPEGGGYMGWHTNSDAPCTRVYITHVPEAGKSFFRYRDSGEYVTSWDDAGWNLRQFEVTKENPLWHCVFSDTKRLSIGFRINRNLK